MPAAMRFFHTNGPVVPADHYCVPPLERLNLDEVLGRVRDKRYFVLHSGCCPYDARRAGILGSSRKWTIFNPL